MKKWLLLSLLFTLSTSFYAQKTTTKLVLGQAGKKTDATAKNDIKTAEEAKRTADAAKKREMEAAEEAKKTADAAKKREMEAAEEAKKTADAAKKREMEAAEEAKKTADAATKRSMEAAEQTKNAELKLIGPDDKPTGEFFEGRTIYTGPKGGRYYINANNNKTYVPRNK